MNIQFNTDKNTQGGEEFRERINTMISDSLNRFKNHITRIEVHLSDENAGKSGPKDKRCLLEARLENNNPVAVTEFADNYLEAVAGACNKLKSTLDSQIGRSRDR